MSPRRQPTSRARVLRVALILCANLAGLALLWELLGAPRGTEAAGAQAPTASEPALPARPAVAGRPARARDADLERRLRACIETGVRHAVSAGRGRVKGPDCEVSVHVRELGTSGELAALASDRAMRPASNLKLVTSAAALVLFGADGHFETVFESPAAIENGVLQGDLVVHAGGDPLYDRDAGGDVTRFFEPVARELQRQGIRRVAGALVLDEGAFAEPAPGPAWPAQNQHWQEFCALSGGFSANAGCLTALVESDSPGSAARVRLAPAGHACETRLDVRTGPARSKLDVRVGVAGGVARVEGSIPRDVPRWESRFAAPDPVVLFGGAAVDALARLGVTIERAFARERRAPTASSRVLARLQTPIVDVLVPINTYSNNACADQLFLTMGRWQIGQGTRAGGRAATAFALEQLGIEAGDLVQVDGSGLSRDNRVTARQITALLDAVLTGEERAARAFRESLAVGGETGTLDRRLASLEGRVHAKTGFIAGTSALSGFLETADGRSLVFSILVEYPSVEGLNRSVWKPMQDAICEVLAGVARD